MNVDVQRVRRCLKDFDFKGLFIEELNWSLCHNSPVDIEIRNGAYRCTPAAEMGGMVVYLATSQDGHVPPQDIRKAIEREIRKQVHEHILVFVDGAKSRSVWQWVKHEQGQPTAVRDHEFSCDQPGDSLLQKLNGIAFDIAEFDANGAVSIIKVTQRVAASFDVEKVTKRFYGEFKKEHDAFCKVLKGLESQEEVDWYASVMLNRLMFIYFIQKKGFLDGDTDYLSKKLKSTKAAGSNKYYRELLVPLFFDGLAKEEKERLPEVNRLLGAVPYLNGGIFMPHKLEAQYGAQISIADSAFERLFAFFDRYNWHLDYRPLRSDNEINPDVLGYIFEKYINQKQMGAYYTKEDITNYICKNTIIPFLFNKLESLRYEELHPLRLNDVEPYIYEVMKQDEYLPTETEREYKARKARYQQLKEDFAAGKIAGINDFITYNLDIQEFAQEWVGGITNPVTLRAFYFECLKKITVLDPTVGSGAFLFAALNILEPLYEICVDKLKELGGPKYPDFAEELKHIADHPNRMYFVFKSIIINNLFGVDIMEEAVEICKLRLFLKLVAQVEDVSKIEPLPDIDFNIKAGNSLVGYATLSEIQQAKVTKLDLSGTMVDIEDSIRDADRSLRVFRELQTRLFVPASELATAKIAAKSKLDHIRTALDKDLSALHGATDFTQFLSSHMPFHWIVEFYGIVNGCGFDVIIGNPPYLEQRQVEYHVYGYKCMDSGAIHAMCIERSLRLLNKSGCMSMIVPLSIVSTQRMQVIQKLMESQHDVWFSNYSWRPGKLFDTVNRALTIFINTPLYTGKTYSTNYQKWVAEDRHLLMYKISYIDVMRVRPAFWVPKLGSSIEKTILSHCLQINTTLGHFMRKTEHRVYYRTTGGLYWKVFTDFPPAFSVNGEKGHSTRETSFSLQYLKLVRPCIAILSSDLFWWWYTITTNCRDLNPYDLEHFPVPTSAFENEKLVILGQKYIDDLQTNSIRLIRNQKQTGKTETQSFKIQKSKPIIDEIDNLLAPHYGFSPEELDFIIHYDFKYRMGRDNDENE